MTSNRDQLPEHVEKIRSHVGVGFKKIHNPTGTYGARTYQHLGYDNSLNMDKFKSECKVNISYNTPEQIVFDIVNVDAPIANALRRILLVEVPTIAIENVFIHKNSSIMHDEQLAHRLGLIPLVVDPRPFDTWVKGQDVTAKNTVKFRLKAKCEYSKNAPRDGEAPPNVLYTGHKVVSGQIEYVAFQDTEQARIGAELLAGHVPRPVDDDILLCKLRPGQEIHVEMDATKNIGREHAKWSPVCTASYRMLPVVKISQPASAELGKGLVEICPAKVFDIEDEEAVVARPRECTMCRECIREEPYSRHVELARRRDHFIFDVESTGVMPAGMLVTEALDVLIGKCDRLLEGLNTALKRRGDAEQPHADVMDVDDDLL